MPDGDGHRALRLQALETLELLSPGELVQSQDRGRQIMVAGSCTLEQDERLMNGSGDVTTFYHDRQWNRFLGCIPAAVPP